MFVFTLEAAARIDDWARYGAAPFGPYNFDQLFQVTERGLRGVPNARYTRWSLNAEGLRGPNVRPDEGQIRIVTYGASETFGMFEDEGKEYPSILQQELNSGPARNRYEVLNAGIPGMRVGSGVTLFRELEARYRPRIIIIYPTPTHYIGVLKPYCNRLPTISPSHGFPALQPRISDKLREEIKRVLPTPLQSFLRRLSIAWQTRGTAPIDRVADASMEAFERDLKCAITAAAAAGMTPILVTHANRFGNETREGDGERLTQWRQQYPEMLESGFMDLERRANESIRKAAQQTSVALVDADLAMSGNPKWFADHAHFSNDGAAKMGALLATKTRELLSLPAR
jgi:hypothetical protein